MSLSALKIPWLRRVLKADDNKISMCKVEALGALLNNENIAECWLI